MPGSPHLRNNVRLTLPSRLPGLPSAVGRDEGARAAAAATERRQKDCTSLGLGIPSVGGKNVAREDRGGKTVRASTAEFSWAVQLRRRRHLWDRLEELFPPGTSPMNAVAVRETWIEGLLAGLGCILVGLVYPILDLQNLFGRAALGSWFCLAGVVLVAMWLVDRRAGTVGLAVTREGLWWKRGDWALNPRRTVLPWEHIAASELVRWTEEGTLRQGILLHLHPWAPNPLAAEEIDAIFDRLGENLRTGEDDNLVLLYHSRWRWDPAQTLATIDLALREPALREQW